MRSDLAFSSLSVFSWAVFSLCLFATPANLTPAGDPAGHTAELIRWHHQTIALL